ncbi:MAG: uracil-DNA glycosylase [Candidatus Pacebacteria bacterium]|nr:uracil-DNA glycosylase [Candidatus Paceibacterota bacterium]
MNVDIEKGWEKVLKNYFEMKSWSKLTDFIQTEYKTKNIYPEQKDIFHAFNSTLFNEVSVIILGQDPYHNPGQAHGLSFSTPDEVKVPPSLKNIYKEIDSDLNIKKDINLGNLESWSKQGVLLLNSVLTVEENKPGSHRKHGWEEFTDYVIQKISDEHNHCVFLLWGNYAKQKGSIIDREKHLVLESTHPSPFSAYNGFFGSRHFSQTNTYLKKHGKNEINW